MPKDKYDKPSYSDRLILGGLRTLRTAKAGVKRDLGKLKRKLKRKKRKKPIVTTRTSGVQRDLAAAGITKEDMPTDTARLKRKKKR